MIRYPVSVKDLKNRKPKAPEAEIIATDDGEILGLRGNVAKLSQVFKVDPKPNANRRSNSVGRTKSRIPRKSFSGDLDYNDSFRTKSIPEPDYKQREVSKEEFIEKQARVEELLKLYANNQPTKSASKTETSIQNLAKSYKKNDDGGNPYVGGYKYKFNDPIPQVRDLKRGSDVKIMAEIKVNSDLATRYPYGNNISVGIENDWNRSHRFNEDTVSKLEDYDVQEVCNRYSENHHNQNFIENNNRVINEIKREVVEPEVIETWEEVHCVPFDQLPDYIKPRYDSEIDNRNYKTPTPTGPAVRKQNIIEDELFPNNERTYKYSTSPMPTQPKPIEIYHRKNDVVYERKSLAEILCEYQQKGVVPTSNYETADFQVKRKEFFIDNNIDTTSTARTIDVVPHYAHIVEDNANPYQNTFHVAKENPLYTNNYDWQDTIGKNKWTPN